MKTRILVAALALAGLCGCKTVNTYDPAETMADRQFVQDKRIITDFSNPSVANIIEGISENGHRKIQVELVNDSPRARRFSYRFEWFDGAGMLIESPSSLWVPIQMEGKDRVFIGSTALSAQATDFRLRLQESTK